MNKIVDISNIKISCSNCTLSELCLPRSLRHKEIEELEHVVKQKSNLQRGEYLYRVGDPFRSIFAIKTGSMKVFLPTAAGEEQIIGFHLPGELLGLDAIEHNRHACDAVSLEHTSVCELPFEKLEKLCQQFSGINHQFYRLISKKIASEHQMLLLLGKKSADQRLATFLYNIAMRFKSRGLSAKIINLSMSRHDIANYLGLAVETISRLFTRFQEENLITAERRQIVLKDLAGLRKLAGYDSDSDSALAQ